MILATYQPKIPVPGYGVGESDFYYKFGYDPIWAFSAQTILQFWLNNWTIDPVCPQKLILFESDDYYAVNKIDMEAYRNDNLDFSDIHIYKGPFDNYEELEVGYNFAVARLENIIYTVDLEESVNNLIYKVYGQERAFIKSKIVEAKSKAFRMSSKQIVKSLSMIENENLARLYRKIYLISGKAFDDYERMISNEEGFDIDRSLSYDYIENHFEVIYQRFILDPDPETLTKLSNKIFRDTIKVK